MRDQKKAQLCDKIGFGVFAVTAAAAVFNTVRWCVMGSLIAFVTFLVCDALLVLLSYSAWKGRMPWLLLLNAVGGAVLFSTTNYTMGLLQPGVIAQLVASVIGLVAGTVEIIRHKLPIRCAPMIALLTAAAIGIGAVALWQGNVLRSKNLQGHAQQEIWEVPSQYDAPGCAQAGTVEELLYETKAYGTDSRAVTKRALVYLPYGYDESKSYNILYLMHGTGDDENYWLVTHPENKNMLDQLIAQGQIEPLIVVTPTFYTENDCVDNLDTLTYSFREELRNDLMIAVESKYSTYAESCDEKGFKDSRDHRSFAGLSRGAVTACHSALCGSLDYFSWFGLFSAFRTEESYLREHLRDPAVAELPIHYLYMTSGNFDFALPGQIPGYRLLLNVEPRLNHGVNADFDIYPMRYHSADNWHLALYNYLQRIF